MPRRSTSSRCAARSRRARMPPCTFGWSVLTRPSSISGEPGARGNVVKWHTASEFDILGFQVVRAEEGFTRAVGAMVPGSAFQTRDQLEAGYTYAWHDEPGHDRAEYWLDVINLNGVVSRQGP